MVERIEQRLLVDLEIERFLEADVARGCLSPKRESVFTSLVSPLVQNSSGAMARAGSGRIPLHSSYTLDKLDATPRPFGDAPNSTAIPTGQGLFQVTGVTGVAPTSPGHWWFAAAPWPPWAGPSSAPL